MIESNKNNFSVDSGASSTLITAWYDFPLRPLEPPIAIYRGKNRGNSNSNITGKMLNWQNCWVQAWEEGGYQNENRKEKRVREPALSDSSSPPLQDRAAPSSSHHFCLPFLLNPHHWSEASHRAGDGSSEGDFKRDKCTHLLVLVLDFSLHFYSPLSQLGNMLCPKQAT